MSRSRLIPGKTTTADFIVAGTPSSAQFDPITLDHGIGQKLLGSASERRLGAGAMGAFDLNVKDFTLPHAGHPPDPERAPLALDGFVFRIENSGLERNGEWGL